MAENNVIQFKVPKAFAHLDPNDTSLGGGIVGGFSSIGYKSKTWSLRHRGETYYFTREDDNTPSHHIDVIIVGVNPNVSKTYYPEWSEDSAGAPLCTAVNGVLRGPDPGVPAPQARSCSVCPRDEWKTMPNGRRGKECQDNKRLAVILMPRASTRLLGAPLKDPVYLKVPPGSLTALRTFHEYLQHQGLPYASVITRISFERDHQFRLKFDLAQVLTDAEAPFILSKLEDKDPLTKRIVGSAPDIHETDEARPVQQRVDTAGLKETFGSEDDEEHPDLISGALPKGAARLKQEAAAQPAPAVAKRPPGRPKKLEPTPAAKPAPAKAAKPVVQESLFGSLNESGDEEETPKSGEVTAPPASWEDASSELSEEIDSVLDGKLDKIMQ